MQISIQMLIRQKAYWLCSDDDYFHVNIRICQVNSIQSNQRTKKAMNAMPYHNPETAMIVNCECINFIRRVVKKDPSWVSRRMIGFSLLLCMEHGTTQGLLGSGSGKLPLSFDMYSTCVNTLQT